MLTIAVIKFKTEFTFKCSSGEISRFLICRNQAKMCRIDGKKNFFLDRIFRNLDRTYLLKLSTEIKTQKFINEKT